MKRGILVYDHSIEEWRLWIGHTRYWIQQGYSFEVKIDQYYFTAFLEKDNDWLVTLNGDVVFTLHEHEIYKVRVQKEDYIPVDAPF
ncbi:DUF5348 domain-containing protein [Sporosarcina jeotgali]|uniref:DUF5348 domain-containing protein n=1 Tax=Sporosarcina jeotgali TaxID=3020056 RepID=A0ABZ0KWN2_9BACL|nr:DUF5348 domain-containing protein [Sporosarcina sp. B2O-1]WOV83269.1 DUF5348 domain-containing protein [Sporosarcina sp. B2O-1]WOV84763.1 DUF5348 domain-containing protein [Sporosarcina sp. B2O-1]WOV85008.1 DUF5348 domain-containing protein [Sporosarcina sp. B2O-1]